MILAAVPALWAALPVLATPETLRAHVENLAGRIGERNLTRYQRLEEAARYIEGELQKAGLEARPESFEAWGRTYRNLVVEVRGRSDPGTIVLIGAHYDTAPGTPGADDNASGSAVLLELAAALKDAAPAKTLRFVWFVNEEPPFFRTRWMGSAVHARGARRRGERIEGMISLEMLGFYSDTPGSQRYPPLLSRFYPTTGNFIAAVSNLGSRGLMRRVAALLKEKGPLPVETGAYPAFVPGIDLSDQLNFWREGFSAMMLTDTAFYRNPHYHEPTDVPARLDYGRMSQLAGALIGAAAELAR